MNLFETKALITKFPGLDKFFENLVEIASEKISVRKISTQYLNEKISSRFRYKGHGSTGDYELTNIRCMAVSIQKENPSECIITALDIPQVDRARVKKAVYSLGELLLLVGVQPLYLIVEQYYKEETTGPGYYDFNEHESLTWELYPMDSFDLNTYYAEKIQAAEKVFAA